MSMLIVLAKRVAPLQMRTKENKNDKGGRLYFVFVTAQYSDVLVYKIFLNIHERKFRRQKAEKKVRVG